MTRHRDRGEHLADIKRDAIAIWRAVLAGRYADAAVVANSTACGGCLAIHLVGTGIIALADDPDIDEHGHVTLPADEFDEVDEFLASLQEDTGGTPPQ